VVIHRWWNAQQRAAFQNRHLGQARHQRANHQRRHRSRRFAALCDFARIAAKRRDIFLDPFQRGDLVKRAPIAGGAVSLQRLALARKPSAFSR
jgi:hypothetical protein